MSFRFASSTRRFRRFCSAAFVVRTPPLFTARAIFCSSASCSASAAASPTPPPPPPSLRDPRWSPDPRSFAFFLPMTDDDERKRAGTVRARQNYVLFVCQKNILLLRLGRGVHPREARPPHRFPLRQGQLQALAPVPILHYAPAALVRGHVRAQLVRVVHDQPLALVGRVRHLEADPILLHDALHVRLGRRLSHRDDDDDVLALLAPLVQLRAGVVDRARRRPGLREVILEVHHVRGVLHPAHRSDLLLNVPAVLLLRDLQRVRALHPRRAGGHLV
eukprot:31497-Pelagococcus_subviridis.AAC.15